MTGDTPVVVVRVGQRRCGFRAADVIELHRAVAQRPLPEAPDVVEGVIDIRGVIVPVVDVRSRLGLPARPTQPSDVLVIVRLHGLKVALRVDEASEMVDIDDEDIVAADEVAPGTRHVRGLFRDGGDVVVIHDLGRFLSWEEAEAVRTVLDEGGVSPTRPAVPR